MFRCCKLLCYVLGCQFGNFRFICILQNLHWQFSVSSNQWKRLLTVLLLRFVLLLVFSIKRLLSVVDVLSFGIRFHLFYFHIFSPPLHFFQFKIPYSIKDLLQLESNLSHCHCWQLAQVFTPPLFPPLCICVFFPTCRYISVNLAVEFISQSGLRHIILNG